MIGLKLEFLSNMMKLMMYVCLCSYLVDTTNKKSNAEKTNFQQKSKVGKTIFK